MVNTRETIYSIPMANTLLPLTEILDQVQGLSNMIDCYEPHSLYFEFKS